MQNAGSTKACYNHTEGTAGLLGVVLAMHTLQQAMTPPVAHARELNPYVAAALSDWVTSSHLRSIISRVSAWQLLALEAANASPVATAEAKV